MEVKARDACWKVYVVFVSVCGGCSQAAQRAQKQSTELFQCMYFRDRSAESDERCVADGVIYSIRTNGVLVFVPR